jgi:uncharacterized membrane protein YheB (UPF0754 family)
LEFTYLWKLLIPPIAGGIIGYFTNDIAIQMLFRPYKPIYFGKRKLPFTPGLIPSNQGRLAQKISDTIMGSLLTPNELQNLAKRLLEIERVKEGILWLLNLGIKQIQEDKEQKTAKILAQILRDVVGESVPRILKVLARREDFLEEQIDQIFDRILLEFRLTDAQARQFSDWLLEVVIPPDILRLALIDFLTDRNIQVIDEGFREKSSGTYWVVANLLGLKNSLTRLRAFCLDEKEITNSRLKELILSLEIRNRIKNWLCNLSMQNLPLATVRQLRKTTREAVQGYIRDRGIKFVEELGNSVDWNKVAVVILNRLRSSTVVSSSLGIISYELAVILDRYLEEDLEKIVAQAIPVLAIDKVIIDRVNATSPQELEESINGIVKSELQAIVNLGGVLGLIVGIFQSILMILT